MTIMDMKKEIVNNIKDIDHKTNAIKRKFMNSLDDVEHECDLQDELMEYIIKNQDDFNIMFKKYDCLPEIDIYNVRFKLYYYDKKDFYGIELDDYFGIELYQYDLIIGGPEHGKLTINGYHDENKNDYDIIHDLNTSSNIEDYACLDNFKVFIQNMYDNHLKKCNDNADKRKKFKLYIRKYRVKLIIDVYKKLSKEYTYILDYSDNGRETYQSIMMHSQILLNEINRELLGFMFDKEYFTQCKYLKILVNNLRKDMQEWYDNVPKYIDNISINNIGTSDISRIILSYV